MTIPKLHTVALLIIYICVNVSYTVSYSLTSSRSSIANPSPLTNKVTIPVDQQPHPHELPSLSGDWATAKANLRKSDCCVVSVAGLEHHMRILQTHFVNDGPADLDLRARVRVRQRLLRDDCLSIRQSVVPLSMDDEDTNYNNHDDKASTTILNDPCTNALMELARGVTSLAEEDTNGQHNNGPPLHQDNTCKHNNVFIRIVCASNYKALDPMYHTDKAPLRGYVTLTGVGTEYMTRPCSPMEYVMLRAGAGTTGTGTGTGAMGTNLRQAETLEFIVMKGDYYTYKDPDISTTTTTSLANSWMKKLWTRMNACVHRSPPGATGATATGAGGSTITTGGRRRVIISLDLADGDDDREWYQVGSKREWRSGMTQRKSRLVA